MRKILVLRGGALGDFIVTLPALALLRQRWPVASIELAGNATAAELARTRGLLDAVHSQHEARWSALFGEMPVPFATWLREFDLILNFWPDADRDLVRRFPLRPGQIFLSAPAMPAQAPAAAHYAEALRPLGIAPLGSFCLLEPRQVVLAPTLSPATRTGRTIAIHPGSGSPRKNWPLNRWAEICAWLRDAQRADLLIVTGEAEPATALTDFGRLARNLPLESLVIEFSHCRLFLGHDSGISHLAAACGVPSILLFGPSDPAMWAPSAPHVKVLRRGAELSAIAIEEVKAAIGADPVK